MFRFRPLDSTDCDLISGWIAAPHIRRWVDYEDAADLLEHIHDGRITPLVVEMEGGPLAYLQHYDIHAWSDHPLGFLPPDARGIDTWIGSARYLHQGFGSQYLVEICDDLFALGCPALGIDPHPENAAAIRAYGKAGFDPVSKTETQWGPALLMARYPA